MNAPDLAADSALAVLVAPAFDMFAQHPGALQPPVDPRLAPAWILRGYLTAQDVLLHPFSWMEIMEERACYGFLAESVAHPGEFVAVIRGTADPAEWFIDAKFAQAVHPAGGHVELGFWSVFQTMRYLPIGAPDSPVGEGIAAAVGKGTLTVIGHSLGAAVATLVTLNLAKDQGMGARVRGRFFASPRPGDQAFADAFAASVADAVAYINPRDEVPEVPKGFGYLPLHCLFLIGPDIAQAIIAEGWAAQHHIYSYAALLNYKLMPWADVPAIDKALVAVILGPVAHP